MNSMLGHHVRADQNVGEHKVASAEASDFSRIEQATDLSALFAETLPVEVSRLREAHDNFVGQPGNATHRDRILELAEELKGHAAPFGYQLITELCDDLCAFIRKIEKLSADQVSVIGNYISAMERVAQFNITGPGGSKAREFVERLRVLAAV